MINSTHLSDKAVSRITSVPSVPCATHTTLLTKADDRRPDLPATLSWRKVT